ncbi:MAG: hypothetical protein IKB71_05550 [Lentisphaeria bacterium]|nr:hypothetical protein [Lentisphaeria bacterium]
MKQAVFIFVCLAVLSVFAAPLKIGWAMESIDPGKRSIMPGYGYFRPSEGSGDPIYATVLVLDNGKESVIFVSLDILNPVDISPRVRAIAKKIAPELPADRFFINATHTHSSINVYYPMTGVPAELGLMDSEDIKNMIAGKIVAAAQKAWANRKNGKIAYGYGLGATSFNRRNVYAGDLSKRPKGQYGSSVAYAGRALILGRTNDAEFEGWESGSENFINFLFTYDMNDKLTGFIINAPVTAQIYSGHMRKYTSDFWHDVREIFKKKYPGVYILPQASGAGDTIPFQVHYTQAEKRRIAMKYDKKVLDAYGRKCAYPGIPDGWEEYLAYRKGMCMDIAERIFNIFEDTYKWASKSKQSEVVLRYKLLNLDLTPTPIPADRVANAKATLEKYKKVPYKTDGTLMERGKFNFNRTKAINNAKSTLECAAHYSKGGKYATEVRLVRVGDIAFASNAFELFMDYMHRIQGRSPFVQTFVVELAGVEKGNPSGGYLATERAEKNRGYSATLNQCPVSSKGGQELVDATVKGLKELYK